MRVREVMTQSVEYIGPDNTLEEAAAKMKSRDIGPLPVCEDGRLIGMITDRDITVRATAEGGDATNVCVRDIMTPTVIACFEDQLIADAARLMEENQVRRLVVLDRDQRLAGIVSLGDVAIETGDEQLAGSTLEAVSAPNVVVPARAKGH